MTRRALGVPSTAPLTYVGVELQLFDDPMCLGLSMQLLHVSSWHLRSHAVWLIYISLGCLIDRRIFRV